MDLDGPLTKALRASSTKVEHPEIKRLRAENAALRTALKVIDTWARFDAEPRPGYSVAALHPQHVINLCGKAIDATIAGGE